MARLRPLDMAAVEETQLNLCVPPPSLLPSPLPQDCGVGSVVGRATAAATGNLSPKAHHYTIDLGKRREWKGLRTHVLARMMTTELQGKTARG